MLPSGAPASWEAAVGDHLVDVHVELRAAAGHPHVQREHVVVPPGEDLVAGLHDQPVGFVGEAPAGVVDDRRGLLDDRVGGDHLPRHQVLADAEIFERALGLGAPELVGRNADLAVAVGFDPEVLHRYPASRSRSQPGRDRICAANGRGPWAQLAEGLAGLPLVAFRVDGGLAADRTGESVLPSRACCTGVIIARQTPARRGENRFSSVRPRDKAAMPTKTG